jgi:beta-galactosidase
VRFEAPEYGGEFECSQWCDVLSPTTARPVAVYASEFFAGRAAVTRNDFGQGSVYYVGTILDRAATETLLGQIVTQLGVDALPGLPEGTETAVRRSATARLRFLLNLTKERKFVGADLSGWRSALSGERPTAHGIHLDPGAVEILVEG